jgi:hypothetical protein
LLDTRRPAAVVGSSWLGRCVARPATLSIVVFGFFLVLAVLTAQPLSTHPTEYLPHNADGVVFAWGIAWVCHQLAHHPFQLFQANVFHPNAGALAFGEPLVGEAVIAWPFWALTGNDVFTFNATFVTTLALNGLTMFWLAREAVGNVLAAVLAGEMFAFTTGNYDSVGRIQIVSTQWTPLVLFFLLRVLQKRRWRDACGLGLAFGLQGLSCDYYELYVATLLVIACPFFLGVGRLRQAPWARLLGAIAIAAAVLAPIDLMQFYYLRLIESARETVHYARLAEYLKALPTNWLYGRWLAAPETPADHRHFIGFLPIVLGAVGLGVAFRGATAGSPTPAVRSRGGFLAFGVAATLLACGPSLPTPWGPVRGPYQWLVDYVPGYAQVRVATRFLPFVRLALAVFVAAGFVAATRRLRESWRIGAAMALSLLIPLEHLSVPLPAQRVSSGKRVPEVYSWLAGTRPDAPIVEFPPHPQRRRMSEPYWQHFSTVHWHPLVNGFASYYPVSQDFVYDELLDLPSRRGLDVLRALGVRYLVFHPHATYTPEQRRAVHRFQRLVAEYADSLRLVASFHDDSAYPDDEGRLGIGGESVFEVVGAAPRAQPPGGLVPVPRAGWKCVSNPDEGCARAIDGNMATAYSTGKTQAEGQYLRVVFPGSVRVDAVSLRLGRFGNFYPRAPTLFGLVGGHWRLLRARYDPVAFLDTLLRHPDDATLTISVLDPPAVVRGIEVRLAEAAWRFNPWLVSEIEILQVSRSASAASLRKERDPQETAAEAAAWTTREARARGPARSVGRRGA